MKQVPLIVMPPPFASLGLTRDLRRDLRSDHAGETGAVWIYRGMLRVSRDPVVRQFAQTHLATELRHLVFFEEWMPKRERSLLLPLWRAAAFLLGAVPALWGRRWVFVTIDAVERFVVEHYDDQVRQLQDGDDGQQALARVLEQFQQDEDSHRHDAAARVTDALTRVERCWQWIIGAGSRAAVAMARLA